MFFEDSHSFKREEFSIRYHSNNFNFLSHIHRSFEFHIQVEGTMEVVVNTKKYMLKSGDAVLVFPYQHHSGKVITEGKMISCFFSPDIVPEFYKAHLLPSCNLMHYTMPENISVENHLLCLAHAYDICGHFDIGREYNEIPVSPQDDVLTRILLWADDNYSGECLLRNAVISAGYNYSYVSKLFKKKLGITFNQYVNLLRIQKSEDKLTSTSMNITEIAYECGYNSLRVFNRRFREILGMTPSEYRALYHEKKEEKTK